MKEEAQRREHSRISDIIQMSVFHKSEAKGYAAGTKGSALKKLVSFSNIINEIKPAEILKASQDRLLKSISMCQDNSQVI